MCDGRRGGRWWTRRSCSCGGGRCGLDVRTDHRSNKSRQGECSQARHGDADASPPRCPLIRVKRTHEADLRWREVGSSLPERSGRRAVSYTHLRAHETVLDLVCRLLLEKKKKTKKHNTTSIVVQKK